MKRIAEKAPETTNNLVVGNRLFTLLIEWIAAVEPIIL